MVLAASWCALAIACGGDKTPAPPSTGGGSSSTDEIELRAGARLGWSQPAATASELGAFQYAVYVDGSRSVLGGVSCAAVSADAGFECSAPLPSLSIGSHTLELASFIVDGIVLESARSSALRVALRALTLTGSAPVDLHVVTSEKLSLTLQLLAEGLTLPMDLAFAPDGAILVAERTGTVRVVRDGALLPRAALDMSADVSLPEGGLLAITLDPDFASTRLVYTLAAGSSRGRDAFMLARYRDVSDTFGERAVLLDGVPAPNRAASGALRIGPDRKLYVALGDTVGGQAAGNMGSFNGKVLRLNTNATTPDDQAAFSPIYAAGHPLPRALDWQPGNGEMWVLDAVEPSGGRLTALRTENIRQQRGIALAKYDLPAGMNAGSAAFHDGRLVAAFRNNLFVAAEAARYLIRLRFDPKSPERIVSTEWLLHDQIGAVRVVAMGPDGALYICNDNSLFRLAP
jgi:glucose/arabinose dehydrogenase